MEGATKFRSSGSGSFLTLSIGCRGLAARQGKTRKRERWTYCASLRTALGFRFRSSNRRNQHRANEFSEDSCGFLHLAVGRPLLVSVGFSWCQSVKFRARSGWVLRRVLSLSSQEVDFGFQGPWFQVIGSRLVVGVLNCLFTMGLGLNVLRARGSGSERLVMTFKLWVPLAGQRASASMVHEGKITCGEGADPDPDSEAVDQRSTSTRKRRAPHRRRSVELREGFLVGRFESFLLVC